MSTRTTWCSRGISGRVALACAVAAATLGLAPATARAATWTVNTTGDPPGQGCLVAGTPCSIRQALDRASAGDAILIPAGGYGVSRGPLPVTVPVSIEGAGEGTTTIDAGGNSQVMSVRTAAGPATTLSGLTLSRGAAAAGGGIDFQGGSLTLSGVAVSGNSASGGAGGGGIFDNSSGALTLVGSTVSSNHVSGGGQGGGAILDLLGPLAVVNSTLSGNSVSLTGAGAGPQGGGGIYDAGSGATITGSTLAVNSASIAASGGGAARGSGGGGAILDQAGPSTYRNDTFVADSATVTGPLGGGGALFHDGSPSSISDVTIDQNSSNQPGGGIFNLAGAYTVKNTIVAGNGTGCAGPAAISSAGFNLEGSSTCGFTLPTDLRNTDPRLGTLTNNGGPTLTQAPTGASRAIDAGSCTDVSGNPVSTDQRGVLRPQPAGGACDIGAVEFIPASPAPAIVAGSRPVVNGSTRAAFSGMVNPDGPLTTARFEYGLDARYRPAGASGSIYDHFTPVALIGSGYAPRMVTASVSGLVPAALYHVRLITGNGAGRVIGPDQTFVTAADRPPPPPVLGRFVNMTPVSGLVRVLIGRTFVPLTEPRRLASGTEVDARQGTLQLSASGLRGTMSATLSGAVWGVLQAGSGASRGLVTLSLKEGAVPGAPSYSGCKKPGRATSVLQSLHANVSGGFRVAGRFSAGATRAASWATSDRCNGTGTAVQRGTVLVSDFTRGRSVVVRAGVSYLARAAAPKHSRSAPPQAAPTMAAD